MESFFRLGEIKIRRTAALAPMAGVTDRAFRTLCKEQGASLLTGEMASSTALVLGDQKTAQYLQVDDPLRPMGVQLFGHDPQIVERSIQKVLPFAPDFIDLNMGCPAPKVTGPGAGSALMKDPKKAEEMVKRAVKASPIPVTVKMRLGWEEKSGALDFAKRMADAGAAMLCVHGRTRQEMYSGRADWESIAKIKAAVSVPVVGNGDITTAKEALARYKETGVDLVAVGRGARSNPFLFARIEEYFTTGKLSAPANGSERADLLLRLYHLMCEDRPAWLAMRELRKFAAWFLSGMVGAPKMRAKAHTLESDDDLSFFLDTLRSMQLSAEFLKEEC